MVKARSVAIEGKNSQYTIMNEDTARITKETQEYLNLVSGRFEFVFTPTYSSWVSML